MLEGMQAKLKDYFNPISREEYLEYFQKEKEVFALKMAISNYDFCKQNSVEKIREIIVKGNPESSLKPPTGEELEEYMKFWSKLKQYTEEDWQNYFVEKVAEARKRVEELDKDGTLDMYYEHNKSHFYYEQYLKEEEWVKSRISGREVRPSKEEEEIFERANAVMKR